MRHTVFAVCVAGVVGGVGVARAEDAGAFWQPAREKFNQLSDKACDGNGRAFRELMQAAIMEEHPVAQNDLAWVFATERCQFFADDIEAVADLQKQAADAGYPVAQNNIGVKLMQGQGITKNVELAIDYFEAAMRAGYGEAAAQLGIYFAEGVHVERNIARADQLWEDAQFLEADQDMLDRLGDALNAAAPAPQLVKTSDGWAYRDGEAGWNLVQNGALVATVLVGYDREFQEYYYGFYRVSDDPMIHFMGVSVAHAGGRETELDMNGCGGQNCLTDYGDSAQVRIPISARNQAAMLEAFKSGNTVKFRYQTRASYAQDQFKTMTMGLKGSRKAIEALEREAALARPSSVPATPTPQTSAPQSTPSAQVTVAEPSYTGGTSYYHEDTKNGDRFCQAEDQAEFPPHFFSELNELQIKGWVEEPTGLLKPANLDYLNTATTLWSGGLHSSSSGQLVFYKNGAVKELQHTARDGVFDIYEVLSGSWQRDPARGVVLRLKSKWSYWQSGHDHYECTGGTLASNTSFGFRDGKNASWRSCSIVFKCERWSDERPERTPVQYHGSLVEWAPGDVAPKQLKWSQKELKGRD
ncbi:tetratricopeptide repeat protein [Shimia sp. MIT1388]|uniref:tetratricopeptide repeat protein n=1 Tax=Shimia sp. MIT1388 TaxID=3096992 RepID=UPI003999799B